MGLRHAVLWQGRRIVPSAIRSVRTLATDATTTAMTTPTPATPHPSSPSPDNITRIAKHDKSVPTRTHDIDGRPFSPGEIIRQGMDLGSDYIPDYQQKIPTKPVASLDNSLVQELVKLGNTENNRMFRAERIRANAVEKEMAKMGSVTRVGYMPEQYLKSPPTAQKVSLEMLMAAQTHMGHNAKMWNPANSRYIYGIRHGIHIISLEQTLAHLRRAARVVEEVAYRGGTILFVGTRKGHMEVVASAATRAKACYLFTRWTPGSITNRDRLLEGLKVYAVNEKDQLLEGFEKHVDDSRPLMPDLVICLNPIENYTLLYECGLANVPTIGIVDTDADASWVTYPIPANDDSLRSVTLLAGVLGRAGQVGQVHRLAEAEQGISTWETPAVVAKFLEKTVRHRKQALASELRNAKTESMHKTKRDGGDIKSQEELWKMVEAELLGEAEPIKVDKLEPEDMLPAM